MFSKTHFPHNGISNYISKFNRLHLHHPSNICGGTTTSYMQNVNSSNRLPVRFMQCGVRWLNYTIHIDAVHIGSDRRIVKQLKCKFTQVVKPKWVWTIVQTSPISPLCIKFFHTKLVMWQRYVVFKPFLS